MIDYALLKLLHLGALVFWLGPPLGAWLVLKTVEKGDYISGSLAERVSRVFFLTLVVEHVAFLTLLITGFLMAFTFGFMGAPWLTQKLYIVLFVVVPLEIVDVFLGNWVASQASSKLYMGLSLKTWERKGLDIYHGIFTKFALFIIPVSVVLIMFLAASKIDLVWF